MHQNNLEVSATSRLLLQEVLSTVLRRCVSYRNLVNEEIWPTGGCRAENELLQLSAVA